MGMIVIDGSRNLFGVFALLGILIVTAPAQAAVFDEGGSGDLSTVPSSPTPFMLTPGANWIGGTVGGNSNDPYDIIAITVPAGLQLTSFVNTIAAGTTHQHFVGFASGTPFQGAITVSGGYSGLAHFGPIASNAGLGNPPGSVFSTVGVDLLPIMNIEGLNVGASGFSSPLSAGTYTFVVGELSQDSGNPMSYRFDINVVPEPATAGFMSFGVLYLIIALRRRSAPSINPGAASLMFIER